MIFLKRHFSGAILSLLLLLSLSACGGTYDAVSSTEIHYSGSHSSGGLVDLPVLDPEDGKIGRASCRERVSS